MDSYGRYPFANKELRHEIGMPLRTAECDAALPPAPAVLLHGVSCPGFSRDCRSECGWIKLGAAPGDIGIVDVIGDAKVVKRTQLPAFDSVADACFKDEVFLTKRQQVRAVGAVRALQLGPGGI